MALNKTTSARIVLSTAGSPEEAATISREIVERRLAACVSRLSGLTSVYRWQGAVEETAEVLLLIKTSEDRLAELEVALRELHSYEVPEFLVLPVEAGSKDYLAWLCTTGAAE
ncbi:MAG TPA: divalent-cation tolerance protein CutA [Silvibacterium sp.]|jgi:periplasmic divalent cation tolerance protein|nr:divalent-cation tolerance protein CutA [Silvibacterium sp.]